MAKKRNPDILNTQYSAYINHINMLEPTNQGTVVFQVRPDGSIQIATQVGDEEPETLSASMVQKMATTPFSRKK